MSISLHEIQSTADRRAFLDLPRALYANDSAWIEPLRMELAQRLNPKKNSYFRRAEAALWLAKRGAEIVGRITAQIDRHAHPGEHPEGHFGFYEAIDDANVAAALFGVAEEWLRARNVKKIVGPYNFRLEDPAPGFLAHGFEHRPMFMMPYTKPYYIAHAERAGFQPAMQLNCYSVRAHFQFPPWLQARDEEAQRIPGLRVRPIDLKRVYAEAEIIRQIFNEALKDNWGFVPFSEKQVRAMARDMGRIADPRIILIAEVHGKPVGVVINLPNLNDILYDCGGRLFPKGLYRLLFCKKDIQSLRGYAFAILEAYRGQGLGVHMIAESWRRGLASGYLHGEITWILGNNTGMNELAEGFGGVADKRYLIVEKSMEMRCVS